MPIDAPVIAQISIELTHHLPVRINQIYQTFADEFLLCGYGSGSDFNLVISLNAGYGRFHLIDPRSRTDCRETLPSPTIFGASLRKRFSSSKLVAIDAVPFERIVKLTFEVYEQTIGITSRYLMVELTGKSSNFILCDENMIITDAWRRVAPRKPEDREITPGISYEVPSTGGRWRPVTITENQFSTLLSQVPDDVSLEKFFLKHWYGLSALSIDEITHEANFSPATPCRDIPSLEYPELFSSFCKWAAAVAKNDFTPTGLFNETGNLIDCSALAIHFPPENITVRPIQLLYEKIAALFDQRQLTNRFKESRQNLEKKIHFQFEKTHTKLTKQQAEASAAENGDHLRITGELLTTYGFQIAKGSKEVKLTNHYDPEGKELLISLNPALTAQANAQVYFKKYQKAKKGQLAIGEQITKTREALEYLESIEVMAQNALSMSDLGLVQEELQQMEVSKKGKTHGVKKFTKKVKPLEPRQFKTPTGHTILVGRNNIQNDRLTFKIADPNDLWFHTQKIPGSHVILRPQPGIPVDDESLNYACQLAAFFSKAKNSTKIPVDYTQRKNVKKPPAAKPGFVIYDFFKTAIITPDLDLLTQLGVPKIDS
ncbi:MAG TPA: hypothetical protein DDW50_11800 [Firmicutes bacterium]|jgi:predicted ribosome quality control (RQC) complex YloA/Tae2 family protein|nr:hypothetical protein [Bacillota bacterium]